MKNHLKCMLKTKNTLNVSLLSVSMSVGRDNFLFSATIIIQR